MNKNKRQPKRLLALLLAMVMMVGVLAGCNGQDGPAGSNGSNPGSVGGPTVDNPGSVSGATVDNPSPEDDSRYGGHLNLRIASAPTGLDPLKQTGSWKYMFTTCVYEPILTRDANYNIMPSVCDFELSEDETDLKLWVRDGYTFSNGDPVDIYDIEASFNRGLELYGNAGTHVKPYLKSAQVEEEGGKKIFHIIFTEYHEKALYYLAAYRTWWPVMPKEICEKYATDFITTQMEDAIGTGPYVFTEFEDSVQVTVTRRDNYVPVVTDASGMAGTKYAYLDSITFWYNATDASVITALLAGDYDLVEVMPAAYLEIAKAQGIVSTELATDQRCFIVFNTRGTDSPCCKYPSLRKAIMAAIDYESFLEVITDGTQALTGDKAGIVIGSEFATNAFLDQDYYGPSNQEVVNKYLAMAKEEGYNGEPIQLCYNNARTDIPTLLSNALENAGINYELTTREPTAHTAFVGDPSNDWDMTFSWTTVNLRPTLLQDSILKTNYMSEEKDRLLEELMALPRNSAEYKAKWEELAQYTAEGCYFGYLGATKWLWWHPATLHVEDEGVQRYIYNYYWEDPENHPKT